MWLGLGAVFALAFVTVGVGRMDSAARGLHPRILVFRLMIIPGVVALWPILLRKWVAAERAPPARKSAEPEDHA